MVNLDGDPSWAPNFNYAPATGFVTETANYADPSIAYPSRYAFVASHRAGQWIQPATDATQWYWGDNTSDGDASAVAWTQYSGQIYRTSINWGTTYQKPTIGIKAAYQADPSDPNRLRYTLVPKGSVGAVTQGSYYYDSGNQTLYLWAKNGGDPGTRVSLFAPTAIHRGIGVGRANGSDLRLLCHNYVWHSGDYTDNPFSTTSPDGKLVMFHSNMGKKGSRWDVFIAEVPVTDGGGGGGGGCGASASSLSPPHCQ